MYGSFLCLLIKAAVRGCSNIASPGRADTARFSNIAMAAATASRYNDSAYVWQSGCFLVRVTWIRLQSLSCIGVDDSARSTLARSGVHPGDIEETVSARVIRFDN